MNSFSQRLYTFSCSFIRILALLFTGLLFLSSFLSTCYADDMTTQQVLTKWDNPFINLAGMAILLLLFFLIRKWVCLNAEKRLPLLFTLVLGWCVFIGLLLVLFSKTVPAADAMSVYSIAESLAKGDTSVIHPTDSYLSYYPQQVGLTAFFEIIIRIWRLLPTTLPAYHIIKCIYVLLACLIILFQYKTTQLLWKNESADCTYLLLAGFNLPFLMYTSFVYGEIPSFASLTAGIYYLLKLLDALIVNPKHSSFTVSGISKDTAADRERAVRNTSYYVYGALSLLFLTLSVMLRKNSLILIIAVLLVVLLLWGKTGQHFLLLFAILCAVLSLSILPIIQKGYELRARNTISSGVPAISYFAMGMQESSRGNGWYNGFNFNTYQESGMDTELTNKLSKESISERFSYFKAHPGYAADFYLHKYLSQWADGTYACRQATLATFGGRRDFFQQIYDGSFSRYFIGYCNIYQNVLYLGAFLFCLNAVRSTGGPSHKAAPVSAFPLLPVYLGLIGVFGGFLFHIIWEANSRYIFLYGLLLLPYAARGIGNISPPSQWDIRLNRKHKHSGTSLGLNK